MVTLVKQSREYIDLDFSFAKHPISNNVAVKKNVNSVKQSILNLMQLKSGDKPYHPEIKSPIYDYLFENASPVMQVVLEGEVINYLNYYEPRASITSVSISFPNVNAIICNIVGTIVNTNEPFNVSVLVDRIR